MGPHAVRRRPFEDFGPRALVTDIIGGGILAAAGFGIAAGFGGDILRGAGGFAAKKIIRIMHPDLCPGGSCFCFAPGTMVLMADGSMLPIEQVVEGDWVLADNPVNPDEATAYQVAAVHRTHTARLVLVRVDEDGDGAADGEIEATGAHPFWTDSRGWVSASQLWPGDLLSTENGGHAWVLSADSVSTDSDTFNLTVDGVSTFYVGVGDRSVLVHNMPVSVHPPAQDWENKGLHVEASNGWEISIYVDNNGDVATKYAVSPKDGDRGEQRKAVEALREVDDKLRNDAAFRREVAEQARSGANHFGGQRGSVSKPTGQNSKRLWKALRDCQ